MREVYRFSLRPNVCVHQVRELLLLAAAASRVIHRKTELQVSAQFAFCRDERVCMVDASTPEGEDVGRILMEYLRAMLGETEFSVTRIVSDDPLNEENLF